MGKFFFHIMSACAELERNLIVERTKTGLVAARARGRLGGRRRQMTVQKVQMMCATLRAKSMTVSELARELQMHRATVYDYVTPDGTPTALGRQVLGTRAGELEMAAD